MGRTWSSPAFNYYTRITSPMTLLPSSPTVRGFTGNNLRGSVRYRRRPPAAASAPVRTRLRSNGLLDRSLGGWLGVRGGPRGGACSSRRARRLARRLARVSLWRMVRGGPGVLPDGSLAVLWRRIRFETGPASYPMARSRRFSGWFEAGAASCPTARSWRFGGWFCYTGIFHGVHRVSRLLSNRVVGRLAGDR